MMMTRSRLSGPTLLLALWLLAGCDGPASAPGAAEWRFSPEPTVEIGAAEGDDPYLLHHVTDVARLSTGQVVVGNAGSSEVRIFDTDGRHVRSIGRAGDGPGEFRTVSSATVGRGDSIVVFDAQGQRVSWFGAGGAFARSWSLEPLGRGIFPERAVPLDDGTVLVFHVRGHMPGDPSGVIRNAAPVVRYDEHGERLLELVDLPGEEWYRAEASTGGTLMFLPFGTRGHAAVRGDRLYVGDGSEYEIRVYGADGQALDRIPIAGEPRSVTPEDIRRFEAQALEALSDPDARRRREALHRLIPYPETMPLYAALLVDSLGRLWLQEYEYSGEGPTRWRVLDPSGGPVAEISMPVGFIPSWIGDDLVLGVLTDDLGVQYVRGYALVR